MFDAIAKNVFDPATGKPYSFVGDDTTARGDWIKQGTFRQQGEDQGWLDLFDATNRPSFSPEFLQSIGYSGPSPLLTQDGNAAPRYFDEYAPALSPQEQYQQRLYSPDFLKFMKDKGLTLGMGYTNGQNRLQTFDANNNPVGKEEQWRNDPDNAFGAAILAAAGGFVAPAVLGAAGAGAAGAGEAAAGTSSASSFELPTAFLGDSTTAAGYGGLSGMDIAADAGMGAFGGAGAAGGAAADAAGMSLAEGAYPAGLGGAGGAAGGGSSLLTQGGNLLKEYPWLASAGGSLLNAGIGVNSAHQAAGAAKDASAAADARLAPWYTAGANALQGIDKLLGNPASIKDDPAYAFQFGEGQKAANNLAASRGMAYSGAQDKALTRYGQNFAGTKLDQSFDRLARVAGLGAGAASQGANNQLVLGNTLGNSSLYTGAVANQAVNDLLGQYAYSQYRKP
jgi:hypothetical protein